MVVQVHISCVQGLPHAEGKDVTDAYCKLELGKQKAKTRSLKDCGSNANFQETVTFPDIGDGKLEITVCEDDSMHDKKIATGVFDISGCRAMNGTYPLAPSKKVACQPQITMTVTHA